MVRRVGFGDDGGDRRASPEKTPDRKPAARRRPTLANLARSKRNRAAAETAGVAAPLIARVVGGGFLMIWLAGWSTGIVFAVGAFFGQFGDVGGDGDLFARGFLFIWISFALIGWWFAARALLRLLRGQPVGFGKKAS